MPLEKGSEIEPSFSIQTKEKLSEYGHNVLWSKDPLGGAQVIGIEWKNGILKGASDPRKDGFAAGY